MSDITNGSMLKGTIYGLYSPDSSTGKASLDDYVGSRVAWMAQKAADAMASTATSETCVWANMTGRDIKVLSVGFATGAALTADNTNNAAITVSKYTAAGGSKTTVATETTNVASGNWTAFTVKNLTLTAANVTVAAGGVLTYEISKGGTGVIVPAGVFVVKYEFA